MAGQILLLKNELDVDPLGIGYFSMSNIEVTDSMNDPVIQVNKSSLSAIELLESIEPAALLGLTGDVATRVWGILAMDFIDPFGIAADIFVDAFGAGSDTITELAALRVQTITRANQLGYPGHVREGHVEMARAK